ncbi:MAG TPA: hypothetical protein ENL27_01105 [Candidatus Parcubacteria bacterium]|nr:hypothetical protein [Candidatus Parcubacteria bacterium]
MPFGDGTGPAGAGPKTGRGLGRCGGYSSPGYLKGFGRGFGCGRGWGFGRGFGRRFGWYGWGGVYHYPDLEISKEAEKEILTRELEFLKENVKSIEKRLRELENKKKK